MPKITPPAMLFLGNALLKTTLFIRLPEIIAELNISKGELGFAMLGISCGTLLALPFAGTVSDRLSPRVASAVFLSVIAVLMPFFPHAAGIFFLLAFAVFGFARAMLEVGQNMVALDIERTTGEPVLSRSHGFWPIGMFAASLLSGFLTGIGLTPFQHLLVVGAIVLVAMPVFLRIAPATQQEVIVTTKRKLIALPSIGVALVCAMVFGISLTEGSVTDWSVFFLQEVAKFDPAATSLVFSAFTIGMGAMRLAGDELRKHWSAMAIVRASALTCLAGLALLLLSRDAVLSGVAMVLLGAGVALNAPIGVFVVSRLPGRSAAQNMAAMSMVNLFAGFGLPAVVGMAAETFGLAAVFAGLVPFLIGSFLLAPVARRSERAPATE